uniref:Uncharacterized protein n=1 Tax=Brassica campestris TaxID=3711 RepID=M4DRF3_BRACM
MASSDVVLAHSAFDALRLGRSPQIIVGRDLNLQSPFTVPPKPIARIPAASASSFEVFVDEEEESTEYMDPSYKKLDKAEVADSGDFEASVVEDLCGGRLDREKEEE